MTWQRVCRCAGETQEWIDKGEDTPWCGHPADQEDGLCHGCRTVCMPQGFVVLTPEQARARHEGQAVPS